MAASTRRAEGGFRSKKKGENVERRGVESLPRYFEENESVRIGTNETDGPPEVTLNQNMRDYLCQIEGVLDNDFQDQDDKDLFIKNVFSSIDGEEVETAKDSDASRVIEKILRCCNGDQVVHYTERISASLADLCSHRCGSHVVQTLLEVFQVNAQSETEQVKETSDKKFVSRLVKIVCSGAEQLIVHQYASHVICSLVDVLSSTRVSANVHRSTKSHRTFSKKDDLHTTDNDASALKAKPTEKFKLYFKRVVKSVQQLEDLQGLIRDPHSSTVLQTIMLALSVVNADSCEQFLSTVLRSLSASSSDDNNLVTNAADRNCAHFIEKVIEVSPPNLFEKLFKDNFKDKLKELSVNSSANFVVQRLLKHCPSKSLFEKIYAELEDSWSAITNEGHFGVLTGMAESCVRLNACQVKFVANLAKLLKCEGSDESKAIFVLLIAYLVTYNEWHESSDEERSNLNVNYHGSVLLQNLLRFRNTHQLVNNIIQTPTRDLQKLFCNSYGSYILDAFASSDTVSAKSRSNVILRLKDCVVNLACDKSGSRCLEALWKVSDTKQKTLIVEQLAASEERLRGDQIGAYALNTYAVSLFKRRPEEWTQWQMKGDRKKRLFQDFFVNDSKKKLKKS